MSEWLSATARADPRPHWVAGVDGCRVGWVVVLRSQSLGTCLARVVDSFSALLNLPEAPSVIAVDIPIGLLETSTPGGRDCEVLARRLLRGKPSSVFSAPTRAALQAFRSVPEYRSVSAANRGTDPRAPGLSRQTFCILPKIDEVDAALLRENQGVVREVHPELCFAEANNGRPIAHSKKTAAGQAERAAKLSSLGFSSPLHLLGNKLPTGVKADDVLDACIACWTTERIAAGMATVVPAVPPTDSRGLRMELWR
jgi:predicted RNase H-like nuclease